MILTRVHPGPAEVVDLDAEGSRDRLRAWYAPPSETWLRLNLVLSIGGSAAGPDGTSDTLTSSTDRRLLGVIRELSDIVLVGAQSVRAEGYQVPRTARLAIVTVTGDLSGHRVEAAESERVTVVCPASASDAVRAWLPRAQILSTDSPDGRIPAASVVSSLREAGYRSIVCEGGPSLASQLLAAGLVDEACLTTSPVLRDSTPAAFAASGLGDHAMTLHHLALDDDSYVFSRWLSRSSLASD